LLARADGTRDTTTRVHWMQGIESFADLRQPAELPAFAAVDCLNALSMEDCAHLAGQEGFCGRLRFDGTYFEWVRLVDFQPRSSRADAGSLQWQDAVLVERGRDSPYVEHWHRDAAAATEPVAALWLREADSAVAGLLLRVGDNFMLARDRSAVPAGERSLRDCVAGARDLPSARALIDAEISFGEVSAAGWRITRSTLPFRVGDTPAPRFVGERLATADRGADGATVSRWWHVTATEGDSQWGSTGVF
jgi:hypothetical protein